MYGLIYRDFIGDHCCESQNNNTIWKHKLSIKIRVFDHISRFNHMPRDNTRITRFHYWRKRDET